MLCATPLNSPDFSTLTDRELEVLRLLGRGGSNRQMARWLGITERTTKAHISRIIEKLKITGRIEAIFLANYYHDALCTSAGCTSGLPKGQ
ncbi:helix-turn-helix transcriptional regulator [Streptomyces sp. LHD-70]|uniref:response regulator transcription factor n=1 Tax=Streptomyces sp. LHD-70 TaxID=3072140 RepID=UPI00280E8008|nr:helix-turn-helix transcriptional regulator [Streptomyces sp. LHD-70]MDQ8704704.1 helix-turn-helix transcriptional regulator [Streptomyces sp. LHD-70]